MSQDGFSEVRETIRQLSLPVEDLPTLCGLLAGPLDSLSLLPPQYRHYQVESLAKGSFSPKKNLLSIQTVILQSVIPTWLDVLQEAQAVSLVEQYFCPDPVFFTTPNAGVVAIHAYTAILSNPLQPFSVNLLSRLCMEYPIDRLYSEALASANKLAWEDYVRCVLSVPSKVANAKGVDNASFDVPMVLDYKRYFECVFSGIERLIWHSSTTYTEDSIASIVYVITKLARQGLFPSHPPQSQSQASFFAITMPTIEERLQDSLKSSSYSQAWIRIFGNMGSTFTLQTIIVSLFGNLCVPDPALNASQKQRTVVKEQALLLLNVVGPLSDDILDVLSDLFMKRGWGEGYARIFVAWASLSSEDDVVLQKLMEAILEIWTSTEYIKHALLLKHQFITTVLLLTLHGFKNKTAGPASNPTFIKAVGVYISHSDTSIRCCGTFAAEIVAAKAGRELHFGTTGLSEECLTWMRNVKLLLETQDVDVVIEHQEQHVEAAATKTDIASPVRTNLPVLADAEEEDSDDSLVGYDSPSSSRSASPTPSELEEIKKEPTLNIGVKKIPKPVYLAQLGNLVRSAGGLAKDDADQEASRIEMALNTGEELIRRKQHYGRELEENAVNLIYGFVGLQNTFELDGFSEKRQRILISLVACCPKIAAPCVIEEFYKNQYSTDQRHVMLAALALGARELASMPSEWPTMSVTKTFASRTLPSTRHQKYLIDGSQEASPILSLVGSLADEATKEEKDEANNAPEFARDRRLRIRKNPGIESLGDQRAPPKRPQKTNLITVASESFIMPLLNRFWNFLRDEQSREERTSLMAGRSRYRGAGTGLILNAVVLSQLLGTFAILVHASRAAPEWLAVIVPDVLELAVTVGNRPVSSSDDDDEGETIAKEASVLTTALELALVILDGCSDLDRGKSMGLEHSALLLGTGEWANGVFSKLDDGVKVPGGGGALEHRLKRAAAGVLLKVDTITSQWRRSMVEW